MSFSMSQRVVETMPSGSWNDFTDLPAEFISQFGPINYVEQKPTGCYYSKSFMFYATMMDDVMVVACLLATLVNFIVVACSLKLYSDKGDTLHLFILNMTLGDSILTLFCHPYELLARRYVGVQIHLLTVFLNFANWVGLAVSGLSLTLLNVDKLIFFCWPFKYDIWMSYSRAKKFCYMTWIVSIGFATYYWLYSYVYFINTKVDVKKRLEIQYVFLTVFMNDGQLSPINRLFYEAFTVVFCVVPIISSLFVSCYLYDLTRRKRKLIIRSTLSKRNENKVRRLGSNFVYILKLQASSFAFIFATTLWTSCSLLPYRIANLARIHVIAWPNLACESRQSVSWFTWSMLYLLILNPIINPLITAFAYAPYRRLIFSTVSKAVRRGPKKIADEIFYHLDQSGNIKSTESRSQNIYFIELSERDAAETKVMTPKAPLARFPSLCSCDSVATPKTQKCTRF
ncbi:hypothetical protein CRE_00151 [Caenorhabditis remanei]|uniref:G-protein coupled receptors family 1 profile domain-containing protein n=1 Tax=Caenorhabditis remanei TaxID=31234 RepID=E3LDE9_CAERE|nr:hypothetical protein CRE_00151 [Caenorhabditis remanei]